MGMGMRESSFWRLARLRAPHQAARNPVRAIFCRAIAFSDSQKQAPFCSHVAGLPAGRDTTSTTADTPVSYAAVFFM